MMTSPREVMDAANCSLPPSSVTNIPVTVQAPLVSGPFASSSIVIETIFPCRDLVPTTYFLAMLFASSALAIFNSHQF